MAKGYYIRKPRPLGRGKAFKSLNAMKMKAINHKSRNHPEGNPPPTERREVII